jgi:hypothetical protein
MSVLDGLLHQVKQAITQRKEKRDVKPASQDPYGDPADQKGNAAPRSVKPASEDPYGDPADQKH